MHQRLSLVVKKENGLNTLRLLFALLVIVSHSFKLGGLGPEPAVGNLSLGAIAVAGFFSISGFLIAESRRANDLATYLKKRFFRIIPGYWAVTLVVAFFLAPLISLNGGSWNVESALSYVARNSVLILGQSHDLDIGIVNLAYAQGLNGSLWTLAPEIILYLFLGLTLSPVRFRNGKAATALGLCGTSAALILIDFKFINWDLLTSARPALMLAIFFFSGGVLHSFRESIRNGTPFFAASLFVWISISLLGLGESLGALFFAYSVIWLGLNLPKKLQSIAADNDLSYGFYIYAFPVQQLLASLGAPNLGAAVFIVLSVIATAPFAAASWFWIERPFIKLGKNTLWSTR